MSQIELSLERQIFRQIILGCRLMLLSSVSTFSVFFFSKCDRELVGQVAQSEVIDVRLCDT